MYHIKIIITAINIPVKIAVPEGKLMSMIANDTKARLKRGGIVGAKDKTLQKRRLVGSLKETIKQVI